MYRLMVAHGEPTSVYIYDKKQYEYKLFRYRDGFDYKSKPEPENISYGVDINGYLPDIEKRIRSAMMIDDEGYRYFDKVKLREIVDKLENESNSFVKEVDRYTNLIREAKDGMFEVELPGAFMAAWKNLHMDFNDYKYLLYQLISQKNEF